VSGNPRNDLILDVKKLCMDFGGVRALSDLDLDVRTGEIVALIGPNGAGKTTFFDCVTGIDAPTSGDIFFIPPGKARRRINGLKPNLVTCLGMARTFQNIRLFPAMTALENVMIGRHCRSSAGIPGAIFRGKKTRKEEESIVIHSYRLLERFGLAKYTNELAGSLPYGVQRRIEIARAVATDPCLLLLDEPAAGMNLQETKELVELIRRLRDEDHISILLIEHDMKLVMNLSERIFVVEYGRRIAEGNPREIRVSPLVIRAYLGEDVEDA